MFVCLGYAGGMWEGGVRGKVESEGKWRAMVGLV